jgi:hypothetical protein
MASEESSETRQGIQERLHAAGGGVADEAEAEAEERKRRRTEAAWKAKKAQ